MAPETYGGKKQKVIKFDFEYHMRANITRGLYTFHPLFEVIYALWPLALCMVSIQERFLIKSVL